MITISLISATPSTRGRDLDVEVRQADDEDDADQREPEPVDVRAEYCSHFCLRERREAAEQGDAEDRVADHQRVAGHQAPGLTEAVADVGVHAAGGAHLLGHLGVRDREDREDDRREEERRRARCCPSRTAS